MKYTVLILGLAFCLSPASAEVSESLSEDLDNLGDEEEIGVIIQTNGSNIHEDDFSRNLEVKNNFGSLNAALLEIDSGLAEEIDKNPYVERVEPDYRTKAMLSESKKQINADFTSSYRYNGSNTSIAVMDSGISDHPDIDIAGRRDFTGEGLGDQNGHGTHVAGIIGSKNDRFTGVAPGTNIYDVKVLDSEGSGRGSEMLAGLNYVVKNDMDVAVLSLGSIVERCDGRDVLSRAADQASRSGVVIIAAAGNQGPEEQSITSPGCSREAITVGALDKSGRIAPYSSRGLTFDGRVKPDVVAPGSDIASTDLGSGFIRRSGTSMAAPHVAGQAAILLDSGQDSAQVKEIIINSSSDLGYEPRIQGAGRINVRESLNSTGRDIETRQLTLIESFKAWLSRLLFLY